ncbi:hypothetical protein BDR07DRAFT_1407867 [Suillus spraguei]|nr:hypothetical protein BDR07DRAFT_1407867 [Suillus spraguei]
MRDMQHHMCRALIAQAEVHQIIRLFTKLASRPLYPGPTMVHVMCTDQHDGTLNDFCPSIAGLADADGRRVSIESWFPLSSISSGSR